MPNGDGDGMGSDDPAHDRYMVDISIFLVLHFNFSNYFTVLIIDNNSDRYTYRFVSSLVGFICYMCFI